MADDSRSHEARPCSWLRLTRLALTAIAVAVSLLTFPIAIPWMIAFWLALYTTAVIRRRTGAPPLGACLVVLLVKRTIWTPGLVGLILLVGVALLLNTAAGSSPAKRRRKLGLAVVWLAWLAMAGDWFAATHCPRSVKLDATRPVVCLGDSLTADLPPTKGYPHYLQDRISSPVVNLGQAGMTTTRAIKLLPAMVEANPAVVVVELGGNDYVQGRDQAIVRANLETIIASAAAIGAEVVLVEIPRGLVTDPWTGLERRLAREHGLELVSDTPIRSFILFGPAVGPAKWFESLRMSDDGVHPNAHGARLLADHVAAALERIGK